MHKTIYIDVDEEITSILNRIKKEAADEIFLVVPKGAMLIQGVINLRILKKEAEKTGKTVMIMTNDSRAKKVIRQVGIQVKEKIDEAIRPGQERDQQEKVLSAKAANQVAQELDFEENRPQRNAEQIGSSSFYDEAGADSDADFEETGDDDDFDLSAKIEGKRLPPVPAFKGAGDEDGLHPPKPQTQIPRPMKAVPQNQTPQVTNSVKLSQQKALPTINGINQEMPRSRAAEVQEQDSFDKGAFGESRRFDSAKSQFSLGGEDKKSPSGPRVFPEKSASAFFRDELDEETANQKRMEISKKASRFFDKFKNKEKESEEKFLEESDDFGPRVDKTEKESLGQKLTAWFSGFQLGGIWKWLAASLVLLLLLGGLSFWVYANYPKVSITISPLEKQVSKEIRIAAKEGITSVQSEGDENIIPGKYLEMEIRHTVEFDSTGEDFVSDDGKARGTVTIANKYSANPQPLVATTRVLSKDGKLFRLVESVQIPGMSGETPGKIEVKVIADEPGQDFNIEPTTFTIEGFKNNSEKYQKFEVASAAAMTGGDQPDESKKRRVVSASDLENARKETIDKMEEVLEQKIEENLEEDQKVLVDSIEKEIVSGSASHEAKDVTDKFSYTVIQKIKAIAFSREDVRQIVLEELGQEIENNYEIEETTAQMTFKKGITDLEQKTLTMYADAKATSWPKLDLQAIAKGIAGKSDQEDIRTFLTDYPEIKKAEIVFTPSWLMAIPASEDKIEVKESR